MANEIAGGLSHLHMYDETTWGTKPGSPVQIFVPVQTYDVINQVETRRASQYVGQFDRKHSKNFKGMAAGGMTHVLLGHHIDPDGDLTADQSLAEWLIEWAFNTAAPTGVWMPSKGAEWAEGPDTANRQHNGLRVNSFSLAGSEDSGVLESTFDLMGKNEVALVTAQTVPVDMEKIPEFEFADCTLSIDSSGVDFSGFNLSLQNGLKPKYRANRNPDLLPRSSRVIGLTLDLVKNSDTYNAAIRTLTSMTEFDITITAQAPHNGTGASGTVTTLVIDMPRCAFTNPDDSRNMEELTMQTINLDVLKPDSSAAAIAFTWDLA